MRSVLVRRLLYTSFMTTKTSLQIFKAPWNFGGVNSTGRRLQQEGQGHSGGVAAKAAACEDISYYNEKMLSQQTCLLAYRKTPPQHF